MPGPSIGGSGWGWTRSRRSLVFTERETYISHSVWQPFTLGELRDLPTGCVCASQAQGREAYFGAERVAVWLSGMGSPGCGWSASVLAVTVEHVQGTSCRSCVPLTRGVTAFFWGSGGSQTDADAGVANTDSTHQHRGRAVQRGWDRKQVDTETAQLSTQGCGGRGTCCVRLQGPGGQQALATVLEKLAERLAGASPCP